MALDSRLQEPCKGLPIESTYRQNASIEAPFLDTSGQNVHAALAELSSIGAALPNPAVLINSLPLLQAQASSEIENIGTSSDALFRFAQDEHGTDPATRESLNYRAALREGFESLAQRRPSVRPRCGSAHACRAARWSSAASRARPCATPRQSS